MDPLGEEHDPLIPTRPGWVWPFGLDAEKAGGSAANGTVGTGLACRMFPELNFRLTVSL